MIGYARPRLEWLEGRWCPATNTFTGLGNNDLWSNAANWSLGRAPIATDDVVLAATQRGTSTVNGNYTVASLTLPQSPVDQSHTLQGTLAVSGQLSWTHAKLYGGMLELLPGATGTWADGELRNDGNTPGQFQIDQGATLTISGDDNAHVYVVRSIVRNDGTVTITPAGVDTNAFTVSLYDGASILNMPGGVLGFGGPAGSTIRVDAFDTNLPLFGPNRVTNEGLVNVSGGVQVRLSAQFDTGAQVAVAGESSLAVEGGGTLSGWIDIGLSSDLDAIVSEAKYSVILMDLTTIGSGSFNIETSGDGVVHVGGSGNVVMHSDVTLKGRLDGGGEGSVLEIARQFKVITVGHLSNGLQLYIRSGATAILAGTEFWIETGSSVENLGDFIWQRGTVYASEAPWSPTFWNKGRFEIMGNYTWFGMETVRSSFINDGRMIKSGGNGAANLEEVHLTGTGTVEVLAGCGTIETLTQIFGEGVTQLGGGP